jgi:catechol 2,3-dioxygenase-like lactoylglutathione lyase family enzyme
MAYPNTLIFVDLAADDPAAAGQFYARVFGWQDDSRPQGVYHRMVPGGYFRHKDGSDSTIGNLHIGIFRAENVRPHPDPDGAEPRSLSQSGRKPRLWVLVSEDDSVDRIVSTAIDLGATLLWRDHYWAEFNGFNHAFRDPWGNEIVLWVKGGDSPRIPPSFTRE